MSVNPVADSKAIARSAVLDTIARVLEALREPQAAKVLSRLPSTAMVPGGARVVGTSYELEPAMAAALMSSLIGVENGSQSLLLRALAKGDADARLAVMKGTPPPVVGGLYAHCDGIALAPGGRPEQAFGRLASAIEGMWGPAQVRRLLEQIDLWIATPEELDTMPLQRFVAQFVRNSPP